MPLKPINLKTRIKDIMNTPDLASRFASSILKKRWPEAEPLILKDPYSSYEYAKLVIKGRWPEAESIISKDALSAYYYATNVIKGRWPQGEKAINKIPYFKKSYQHFLANL